MKQKEKKSRYEYEDRIFTFQVDKEEVQAEEGVSRLLENESSRLINKHLRYKQVIYMLSSVSVCSLTDEKLLVTVLVRFKKEIDQEDRK